MKINEENFIEQLKYKNEAALEYVMRTYGGLVKSVVYRYLRQLTVYEEDCINEIFYAVWEHTESFIPEKGSFANWIAGVARFKALDYLRRYSRQMSEEHIEDNIIEISSDMRAGDDREPYTGSDSEYLSEEMEKMLASLNDIDRELFKRLYIEEQQMQEVSHDMQMERPVIYNRLSRARKKLRKLYGKEA